MYKTELIHRYIDYHGLTRAEFAAQAGVSPSSVSRLLNGGEDHLQRSTVAKMANVLGLTLPEFTAEPNHKAANVTAPEYHPTQLELTDNRDKYALPFPDLQEDFVINSDSLRRVVSEAIYAGIRLVVMEIVNGIQEALNEH